MSSHQFALRFTPTTVLSRNSHKKVILIALASLSVLSGAALAGGRDRNWREIERAEEHARKAIHILNSANNDDRLNKDGKGEDALHLLRIAKSKLNDAIDNVKKRK